ncbi:hypothetical protein MMC17_009755 [Xylographa soralifera]|nr:hypothetical protein [Xylographa soralifera]
MPRALFWIESFLFFLLSSATPILLQRQNPSENPIASKLLIIAPQSESCVGAPYPSECRTTSQAVDPIITSFATYGIVSGAEMAALISLMAFETMDFKYQNNYFPGNPGQGTRNMQSASFNLLYSKSIPALASSVAAITEGAAIGALSVSQLNQVRALLTGNDDYDFGSAAWFLTTQCSTAVRAEVQTGTLAGWQTYVTDCIGTTATSDRQRIWEIAMQEIG